MNIKQAIIFGVIFGTVAAALVWYLERFELNRLHGEINQYLSNRDAFEQFLQERGNGNSG